MRRWDMSLEGMICTSCLGTTSVYMDGDAHRSSGMVPCPMGYFQGEGFPYCRGGRLRFAKADLEKGPAIIRRRNRKRRQKLGLLPDKPSRKLVVYGSKDYPL